MYHHGANIGQENAVSVDNPKTQDIAAAQAFYTRLSGVYDMMADSSEHRARERGLVLLAPTPGERVLEIGYGTGASLVELAKSVGPTGHVSGVDISPGMMAVATRRLEEPPGLAQCVDLRVAAIPPIPYADSSFDAVYLSFTLELFPEVAIPLVLAEIRRVLVPGGRLGIVSMAVPSGSDNTSALERTYVWMHRHFPHIVDCCPIDVGACLDCSGFRIDHIERQMIWTMPVAICVARPNGHR